MSTQSRLVRVFISSTFRDFMQERDELVKTVFPELRRRCKERFVELLEVDLRWGITVEQSKSGETLRICLEEIDRCRPSKDRGTDDSPVFFVGLLGERYGWVPPKSYFRKNVLEDPNLRWLREHADGKSVTELEILYGVLRNEKMRDKAFFYLRKDGYQDSHMDDIEKYHAAMRPPVEVRPEDFTNTGSKRRKQLDYEKQRKLKQAVRDASLKWEPRDYDSPQQMTTMILKDLWHAIDEAFPAQSVPSEAERCRLEHESFGQSRVAGYVARPGLFAKLDRWLADPSPGVCAVTGESGSGKSALLAAWLAQLGDHPPKFRFVHYIGGTPESSRARSIVFRLLNEIREWGEVTDAVPDDVSEAVAALPEWLRRTAEGQQCEVLLVLDALNQLENEEELSLDWLPTEFPPGVRLLVSTLPGKAEDELRQRGWTDNSVEVSALEPAECRTIIEHCLRDAGKNPDAIPIEKLANAPQSANALYLRVVLNELKLRASFGKVETLLDDLLKAKGPLELFVQVLKNLEELDRERPDLVRESLGYLGLARRGLTEGELLELLSDDPNPSSSPLPRHYWSPLYLALADALVSRNGQLGFFHEYLKKAVEDEYLDEDQKRGKIHERFGEVALAWSSERFSPTLREYGLAHGVFHLLKCGKRSKALGLLDDENFCADQKMVDPTLTTHADSIQVAIADLAKDPSFGSVPEDASLAKLIEMEAGVSACRKALAREALFQLGKADCSEQTLGYAAALCGALEGYQAEGAALVGMEAICRSSCEESVVNYRVERWFLLLRQRNPTLSLGTHHSEGMHGFLRRHCSRLAPEIALRIWNSCFHDSIADVLLEIGKPQETFRLLLSTAFGGSMHGFVGKFAVNRSWDLGFTLADYMLSRVSRTSDESERLSNLAALYQLAFEAAKLSRIDHSRRAASQFLKFLDQAKEDGALSTVNVVYNRSCAAALLALCGDSDGAVLQLDLALKEVDSSSSSTGLNVRILRALSGAAQINDEGMKLLRQAADRILDRRGDSIDPTIVYWLSDLGLRDVASDILAKTIEAFLDCQENSETCASCFALLGRLHRLADPSLVDRWVCKALQLADDRVRIPPDHEGSEDRTAADVEFIVDLGRCLKKMARIEDVSVITSLLAKTIDWNNADYYWPDLYHPVGYTVKQWIDELNQPTYMAGATERNTGEDIAAIDTNNAPFTLFDYLEDGNLSAAAMVVDDDGTSENDHCTGPLDAVSDKIFSLIRSSLSDDPGVSLQADVCQSGRLLVAALEKGQISIKGALDLLSLQLVAEQLACDELILTTYIGAEFNSGNTGISLEDFEFDPIAIANLLKHENTLIDLYTGLDRAQVFLTAADISSQIDLMDNIDAWLSEVAMLVESVLLVPASGANFDAQAKACNILKHAGLRALRNLKPRSNSSLQLAKILRMQPHEEERSLALWLEGDYEALASSIAQDTQVAEFVALQIGFCSDDYPLLLRALVMHRELRVQNAKWLACLLRDPES